MMSQFTAVFTRLLHVGIYTAIYSSLFLWPLEEARAFWNSWPGWVFYIPMALVGVPPEVFGIVALIDLLYQFWVHTEHVPKLGWFDRWFCSPSNHRVHHAVNEAYLDKNYGGILILWDRLFGSFKEESEPCVYGTRSPLNSWNPLWANVQVYAALLKDAWHTRRWADKLRVFFKPPGWRPADVAQRFPKPAFAMQGVQKYEPWVSKRRQWAALLLFIAVLQAVSLFLWFAQEMSLWQQSAAAVVMIAVLWGISALLEPQSGNAKLL
jgi:alkylglycerol monooxygenase